MRWSRRKPLTIKSYKRVEEMIVTLQLPPGSAISELTLRKRLGMSLTPGEALQRLAREVLVIILPRLGIMVSDLNARQRLRAAGCQ